MEYFWFFIAGLVGIYIFGFVFGDNDLLTFKGLVERVFIIGGFVCLASILKEIVKTAVKEAIREVKDEDE